MMGYKTIKLTAYSMDELTKKVIAIKDTIKPDSPIRVYEFDYDGHILNGVELTVIE